MNDNVIQLPTREPSLRDGFQEIKVFESDERGSFAVVIVCAAGSDALQSLIAAVSRA